MKIAGIRIKNDIVLGDIEFDFTLDGKIINTIILAGENGVGKTRLLEIIYDFTKDDKAIIRCIIDYLSGMSDEYIIKIFNELISF